MAPPVIDDKKGLSGINNLLPPEDTFWRRYSAHHEFPLAGVSAFVLHALVIGLMLLAGLFLMWSRGGDTLKPPRMDVVQVEGGGDGFEGLGGEPGLGGPGQAPGRTEFTGGKSTEEPRPATVANGPKLQDPPKLEFRVPILEVPESAAKEGDDAFLLELAKIGQEADNQVKKAMNIPKAAPAHQGPGTGSDGLGPKGTGGMGGGKGSGFGSGKGAGMGRGGPGRLATRQEVLAWRWRFHLAGSGKEHAEKLDAMGVVLAFPDGQGGFRIIRDLKRRPVEARPENLVQFKDAVKWYNTRAESVAALMQELQLPVVPPYVVMLLPKEREERWAAEEMRFAAQQRRRPDMIHATYFDFQLRNGAYEPVVLKQE